MRKFALLLCLFALSLPAVAQQILTNDGVIQMKKAGLSDDLILTTIQAAQAKFDVSPSGLIALKSAGLDDKLVEAIAAKSTTANVPTSDGASPMKSTPGASEDESQMAASSTGTEVIPAGARVVIAPMGGFETYFAAAVRQKKVPIKLTLDRNSAQFFVVSAGTAWQGFVYGSDANWNSAGGEAAAGATSTRGNEASIMVIDAKTKDVVWAYEVHKNSRGSLLFGTFGARGQQSVAEACAKHLKEYIEKGK